jgi:hypothetical protein
MNSNTAEFSKAIKQALIICNVVAFTFVGAIIVEHTDGPDRKIPPIERFVCRSEASALCHFYDSVAVRYDILHDVVTGARSW